MDLLKEKKDYDILPGLLEGYKKSGRVLRKGMAEKLIRRAAEAGRGGVVMECLRRVEKTGVRLDDVAIAREAMWVAVRQAVQSEWSETGLEKALKFAEGVLDLLEDTRHMPPKHVSPSDDPLFKPEIAGVALDLSAALATKYPSSMPSHTKKLGQYVKRMSTLWPNADLHIDPENWNDANYKLLMWLPVWHGLKMANRLPEKSPAVRQLTGVPLQQVGQTVEKARDVVLAHGKEKGEGEGMRRGLKLYAELAGALSG